MCTIGILIIEPHMQIQGAQDLFGYWMGLVQAWEWDEMLVAMKPGRLWGKKPD